MEKQRVTKSDIKSINYTKKWLEAYLQNSNDEAISKYLKNLYNHFYSNNNIVYGVKKSDKKNINLTADYIKDKADRAHLEYAKNPTQENKDLAVKWNNCYKSYIKNVVEKVLNKSEKQTEMI